MEYGKSGQKGQEERGGIWVGGRSVNQEGKKRPYLIKWQLLSDAVKYCLPFNDNFACRARVSRLRLRHRPGPRVRVRVSSRKRTQESNNVNSEWQLSFIEYCCCYCNSNSNCCCCCILSLCLVACLAVSYCIACALHSKWPINIIVGVCLTLSIVYAIAWVHILSYFELLYLSPDEGNLMQDMHVLQIC